MTPEERLTAKMDEAIMDLKNICSMKELIANSHKEIPREILVTWSLQEIQLSAVEILNKNLNSRLSRHDRENAY